MSTNQKTVGIVGGGQLGRMLSEAALKLGFKVVVIDPSPNCPAKQVGAEQIIADYKDEAATLKLAERADFLTIEFEHINTRVLEEAAKLKPVNPTPLTIQLIQNKYNQKLFLIENNLPTAEFKEIPNTEEAEQAFDEWGKTILKSKTDSFDGRGNALVNSKVEVQPAMNQLNGRKIYAEKVVDFKCELAVMVAKDLSGNIMTYPTVQTVHERNICIEVYAPAKIEDAINKKAQQLAKEVVGKLDGAGVYGVEMFLTQDNNILLNEIAPRVHNSGHYTMDMFDVSQFEQHIRAITGIELKQPQLKAKACVMVNILGERNGETNAQGVNEAEKIPGVSVYLYGKSPTKIDRKMGHINAVADTIEEAKDKAKKARSLISI